MLRIKHCAICLFLTAIQAGLAQTAVTSSIAGRMLSEDGRTVRGIVSLQFAAARGFPSPTRRNLTGPDGSFSFAKLPAGTYSICAQILDLEAQQPAVTPFLDTCSWGSVHPLITVAAGDHITGLAMTAPKGTWLKIRVADPDKVLPQVAAVGVTPLEPAMQVIVKGADHLNHRARFVSADSGGRNYQMVVPVGAALQLSLASSVGSLFDQTGAVLKATDAVPVQAATGIPLSSMTFTIHKAN